MGKLKIRVYGPLKNYTKGAGELELEVAGEVTIKNIVEMADKKLGSNLSEVFKDNNLLPVIILCDDRMLEPESKIKPDNTTIHLLPPSSGG